MTNYYQILGIDRRADSTQIRAAYKRMAMAYHPDHNPGNPQAEDLFKMINEAYHTLSDPLKKARYDSLVFPEVHIPRPIREHQYRKAYAYHQPHKQAPPTSRYYKIDKAYYKHQGLSLLVYVVLAGFCFVLMNAIQYVVEQRHKTAYQQNTNELQQAGTLFKAGKFDDAFTLISSMTLRTPLELRIHYTRDSLVNTLKKQADENFESRDFSTSTSLYLVLRKYEDPDNAETLRRISMGQYYLGNYKESLEVMQLLDKMYPDNLELVYSMAVLTAEKLQDPTSALPLFTKAKSMINRNLKVISSITNNAGGKPDFIDDLYAGSAQANFALGNYDAAVEDCHQALMLNQEDGETYKLRAMANMKLERMSSVCADLRAAGKHGASEIETLKKTFCN